MSAKLKICNFYLMLAMFLSHDLRKMKIFWKNYFALTLLGRSGKKLGNFKLSFSPPSLSSLHLTYLWTPILLAFIFPELSFSAG